MNEPVSIWVLGFAVFISLFIGQAVGSLTTRKIVHVIQLHIDSDVTHLLRSIKSFLDEKRRL